MRVIRVRTELEKQCRGYRIGLSVASLPLFQAQRRFIAPSPALRGGFFGAVGAYIFQLEVSGFCMLVTLIKSIIMENIREKSFLKEICYSVNYVRFLQVLLSQLNF